MKFTLSFRINTFPRQRVKNLLLTPKTEEKEEAAKAGKSISPAKFHFSELIFFPPKGYNNLLLTPNAEEKEEAAEAGKILILQRTLYLWLVLFPLTGENLSSDPQCRRKKRKPQ